MPLHVDLVLNYMLVRMLAHDDIQHLNIPLGLYPSNDEPDDEVKKMLEIISKKPISAKSDYKHYNSCVVLFPLLTPG